MDVAPESDPIGNNPKRNKSVFALLLDGAVGGPVGTSNDLSTPVGGVGPKGL